MERSLGRKLEDGEFVDHINGNKLDNRRGNLRVVTFQQNMMNRSKRIDGITSQYFGVSRHSRNHKKWTAAIGFDRKQYIIGAFASEDEAAWMRDQWTLELFGEYGRLNFAYEPVEQELEQTA